MLFADRFSAYLDKCITSFFLSPRKMHCFYLLSLGQTPSVILARKHGGGEYSFRERTDQGSGFPPQHCCPQNWNLSRVLMVICSGLRSLRLTERIWKMDGFWFMGHAEPSPTLLLPQGLGG